MLHSLVHVIKNSFLLKKENQDIQNAPHCKICGSKTSFCFSVPKTKKTGHDFPDAEDDCPYYRCDQCNFLFTNKMDNLSQQNIYDETYWENQDPDWHGRVSETLRLCMLANQFLKKNPWELNILDFGCGMGCFVETGRKLGLQTWGMDIITPKFGKDFYITENKNNFFDVITACEVIEHLVDPVSVFQNIYGMLKKNGVFAFQTAYYDPETCQRDWWYIGPDNGHISLYSPNTFDFIYNKIGFTGKYLWDSYLGLQAWQK